MKWNNQLNINVIYQCNNILMAILIVMKIVSNKCINEIY